MIQDSEKAAFDVVLIKEKDLFSTEGICADVYIFDRRDQGIDNNENGYRAVAIFIGDIRRKQKQADGTETSFGPDSSNV